MVFDRYRHITNFVSFYLICIAVTIATIWMSVFGYDYKIFEEIGGGIDIYEHTIRNYLEAHAGVLRTSELAAWHLATGACFSLILAVQSREIFSKVIFTALTVLCLLTGIFTGRRKMYALFAIFCLTLLLIVVYESKGKQKTFVFLAICLFSVIIVSLYFTFQQQILVLSFASNYLSRAFTVLGDSFDRLILTFNAFEYTVQRMSIVGTGIGSTGQGLVGFHQVGSNWNAETGIGRLGNELGFIGFIILVTTAVVVLGHIVTTTRIIQEHDQRLSFFQRALVAFLFANAINYFNAAQAYNDLFVLMILGLTLGCILDLPKIFYFSLSSKQLN
jgi:nitrate reductase NapE component